jgi:CheY-like chemotaxis protein
LALIALAFALGSVAVAQPPMGPPPKPFEILKLAREYIYIGKYDLAAEKLKELLDAKPTDADYLDMQKRYGNTVFNQLGNVLRFNDNPKVEEEARGTLKALIAAADLANKNSNRDPVRIEYFMKRLAGPREERIYAEQQLKTSGDAIVPVAVELLRTSDTGDLRSAILTFLPTLQPEVVPGLLASVDGMPDVVKPMLLQSIAKRADILALVQEAETDFLPYLWYYAGAKSPELGSAKKESLALLNSFTAGTADRKKPEAELLSLAMPFVNRKAKFRSLDPASDLPAVDKRVRVPSWDFETNKLKDDYVTRDQAEEYYGLRYLRWALEINPEYLPAQEVFVQLAAERAVARANFGTLVKTEPAAYQLLSATPGTVLFSQLELGLREKRTALVLGMLTALADRWTKAPKPTNAKTLLTPILEALDYPDARVQFAAANLILRAPGVTDMVPHAKIVDILKRALAADAEGMPEGKIGRALITDPDVIRGEQTAAMFRDAGFVAERFATGRELLRRIARATDFDLIVVDRHALNPLLGDLLSQLNAAPITARVPTLVIASSDKAKSVPFEHILLRFALLVAATDVVNEPNDPEFVPETFVNDPLRPVDNIERAKKDAISKRDSALRNRAETRLRRLQKLIAAADIPLTPIMQRRVDDRLVQLTYAILVAEFNVTQASAPAFWQLADEATRINKANVRNLGDMPEPKLMDNLTRLLDPFEITMNEAHKKRFEQFRKQVQPEPLGIAPAVFHDEELERSLAKTLKHYPLYRMIPEPFGLENLKAEIKASVQDPAAMPRDPAEKLATAKLAVEWLRKMAIREVPGYDVKPVEVELRRALRNDDLAPDAIDAVARFGTSDAQQDLANVALSGARPLPLRLKAAEAAIHQTQVFGRLAPATFAAQVVEAAEAEKDIMLKAKLSILANLLAIEPKPFGAVIQKFPVKPLPLPVAPPVPPEMKN